MNSLVLVAVTHQILSMTLRSNGAVLVWFRGMGAKDDFWHCFEKTDDVMNFLIALASNQSHTVKKTYNLRYVAACVRSIRRRECEKK